MLFLVNSVLVLTSKYMCYVRHPHIGYRILPQYRHLLPACTGRPADHSYSALYLDENFEGYDEVHSQLYDFKTPADQKSYPGAESSS